MTVKQDITIEQALSKSAKAHGFETMGEAAIDAYNKSDFALLALIVNRAMEIYAASAVQQERERIENELISDTEIETKAWKTCSTKKQEDSYYYGARWMREEVRSIINNTPNI